MAVGTKSVQDPAQATPVPDAASVREQLERLLVHPLFSNSKRYPVLLAHTVEQTLKGNAAELKERSIGIDVFGRSPTYDANADPVVRITAGEVRKRLMQYYYDSAHDAELVIELPIGSYIPVFHPPDRPAEPELPPPVPEPAPLFPLHPSPVSSHPLRWLLFAAFVAVVCAVGLGIGLRYRNLQQPSSM